MTAKDREIQVYEMNEDQIPSDWPRDYVGHSDHLRAVKLAQIEVLEEMQSAGAQHYGGHPYTVEFEWIGRKIAALRKELAG